MKMKMKLLFVPIVMVMMSVPGVTTFTRRPPTTTTAGPAVNLDGKMFTLSSNGGGISFYPPSTANTPQTTTPTPKTTTTPPRTTTTTPRTTTTTPKTTTRKTTTTTPKTTTTSPKTTTTTPKTTTTTPKTTTRKTTTTTPKTTTTSPKTTTTTPKTTTTTPRTTPLSTTGFSVCLRFLNDYSTTAYPPLLKLFPSSSSPVTLGSSSDLYYLTCEAFYYSQSFKPCIQLWPGVLAQDIWTRVCVTVDGAKKVAQVFSGSYMSVRKMLPSQFPQGNEPVIYVPGFDGQLTDVQMWDYPVSYREILQYMRPSAYRTSRGSVLTWSNINYSLSGNVLLEDTFEMQEQQPIRKRGRGRGLRGEKSRRLFRVGERKSPEEGELR